MAQHDYVIANGTGAAVRSDLNNALAAIVSQNSGATEPATMYAYQWWADTSTGLLKLRNAANNAWITLRELDGTLTIEDGTASSPGLAFADDLNTGIFSPSADQVAFTAGGTARLTATTTAVTSALPVDVPLGSASAPTVTFTGDLNTGIYSPGADQVAISTSSAQRVTVDGNGNVNVDSGTFYVDAVNNRVAIGSSSPQSLLHLETDGTALRIVRGSSTGFIYNTGTSLTSPTRLQSNDGSVDIYTRVAQPITFTTNDTEKARIDSSGRLLVGTSSARSNVYFGGSGYTPANQFETTTSSYNNGLSIINNGGGSYPANLWIGATGGTAAGSNTIIGSQTLGNISFVGADGSNLIQGARIHADTDGTIGAGDLPTRLVFSTTADGASSPTERMKLLSTGQLNCIGVYNDTTAVAANVYVASSGNILRSTSSSKYKTDIETIDYSYSDKLLDCRPVWYRSTCNEDNPAWGWWGFIAEEVAKVDPRLVHWKTVEITYDEKGSAVETPCEPEPEGVQYDRFVPHLLNLIKRQKEQIEAMEARLTALETP